MGYIMFCGIIWGYVILCVLYFALPVAPLHFVSSRYGNSRIFRLITPPITGILLGLYCSLGAFLVIKYLGFDESVLAYSYVANPYRTIVTIVGAISGVLLQTGARFRTRIEKTFFICGTLILLLVALFTGLLIMTPE